MGCDIGGGIMDGKLSRALLALFLFFASTTLLVGATTTVSPVVTFTCSASQFATALASTGVFSCTQPAVGDISGLGTGVATFLGTPSSANLAAAVTDEEGTGTLVFSVGPVLTAPSVSSGAAGAIRGTVNTTFLGLNSEGDAAVAGSSIVLRGSGAAGADASSIDIYSGSTRNFRLLGTGQFQSTIATGTAPFVVASTTRVANLNVATAGNADTVTTNANLTGPITSVGNATSIASQTGTGTKFVMDTGPTISGPTFTGTATFANVIGTVSTPTITANAYTAASTDCGTLVRITNSNVAVTVTLPNSLAVGCNIAWKQVDTTQITFSAGTGATLTSAHSYTKTFGQNAIVGTLVTSNSGGSAASYTLTGDGA